MKIYFNSDFIITKREYEEYYLGSEYHNKIEVYFPMTTYGNYTYIYPVFNVKRPDDRKFGEFALTEYNVENDYIVWSADLPAKALEVEGTLEITIIFKYSTDNKYAKVSTGKVLLNVKEAIVSESDIIYVGEETNFLSEIDAIRNEFGVRFNNVETSFINDLAELDNYKTPGIYRFNYNNANVFDLYITRTYQIRSSSNGYYRRSYNSNDGFGEWIFNEYNVNGSTQWNSEIQYSKGDIVRNNAVYVCITDNKGYAPEEDDENNPVYWIKFEPENYILEDNLKTINGESIVGSGNIEIKGGSGNSVDLSDYLKNGDKKPDDYFNATYKEVSLYGKHGYVRVGEYTTTLSHQDSGGYSSVYMGSGRMDILADNDVSINNKSFNKLYEDVQLLKGDYNLVDSYSGINYQVSIASSHEKYAMISKVGGMSYKSTNLFNGVYEFGSLNTSTGAFESGDYACCSDYIKVDSNTTYSYRDKRNVSANFETIFYVVEYDVNKGFIQHKLKQLSLTNGIYFVSFTTQATTKYIRFMAIANYKTEYMPTEATLVKGSYTSLDYIEYFDGIRHTKVADVLLDDEVVIPLNDFQQIEGYGLGINDTYYNYLDFDKDILVDNVVYEKLDNNATVSISETSVSIRLNVNAPAITEVTNLICNYPVSFINGSYAYVPLTAFTGTTADTIKSELGTKPFEIVHLRQVPIERAIPQINTFIDVSSGGQFTFENEQKSSIPYEIKYIKVV